MNINSMIGTTHRTITYLVLAGALMHLLIACGGGGGRAPFPGPVTGGGGSGGVPIPGTGNGGGGGSGEELQDGVLATFAVGAEQFQAWVTAPLAANLLSDAWNGSGANVRLIRGTLFVGSGVAAHNAPWSWHLDPRLVDVNPTGSDVCGMNSPSDAEAWAQVGEVGSCRVMWVVATLVNFVDLRNPTFKTGRSDPR